ncbi:MAG TPA: bifunctional demethylmenaquinone methyltransferase/2-methoxy-6-polyprenyl-1,4-benzoquinol methylase UbiE [Candidatus Acidoferrales bacterium]|jgi:demethylmenaquinone methyltransferase/2-methoxy-6-polyprenyl-1,4-benzoquinol methylase|nr:bifunctional demethylmenaquinone methyltransferase/2-methoxy-6-polyprenyl-1,4-benzoquinol methylase UbiE [Candidatus Acidoferrales bacterium]
MTAAPDAGEVRAMFDRIAPGYDRANTLLSFGRDRAWRRRAAAAAAPPAGGAALDVACGTGRLTRELCERVGPRGRVVGLDFSERMLAIARAAHPAIEWVQGDATRLPFEDSSFDAATTAFGLRNLANPEKGLSEMRRVVRSGGTLVVLEFLQPPRGLFGRTYALYLQHALPCIGGWAGGDRKAYRYLSSTVASYMTGAQLLELSERSGWERPQLWRLNGGTVALLRGSAD